MKKTVLFLLFLASMQAYAQKKNLGVGTPAPNPNAALHVESPTNDQGFIMPRLTMAQRTSLATVLTATDNGLMLYDTDLKTIYIWDGAFWKNSAQVAGGNRLSYPYKDSVTTAVTGNDVFALKYNNAAGKRVLRVESLNPANGSSAVSVLQNGTGLGIFSSVSNPTSGTTAIYGTTNSNLGLFGNNLTPVGVYGEATGTGSVAGSFRINNATNTFSALYSETNGTGPAARINAINANSTAPALEVIKAGTGNAIQTTGKIQAGQFIGDGSGLANVKPSGLLYPFKDSVTNALTGNDLFALKYNNASNKNLLRVESLNPSNGGSALSILQNGTGDGIFVNSTSDTGTGANVSSHVNGKTSTAGFFGIFNQENKRDLLELYNNGLGKSIRVQTGNPANTEPALEVIKAGTGNAIQTTGKIQAGQFIGDGSLLTGVVSAPFTLPYATSVTGAPNRSILFDLSTNAANQADTVWVANFSNLNAAAFSNVLRVNNLGSGAAFVLNASGTGSGGNFVINNTANIRPALSAFTNGSGAAISATNGGAGNGFAGFFNNSNATNTFPAIQANSNGTGSAIRAFQGTTNGDGPGIDIFMQKPTSPATALVINGNHSGSGVQVNMNTAASTAVGLNVNQKGLQAAANFNIDNAANNISTINANTNGTGNGGYFAINNPTSGAAGLFSTTNGTGTAIQGQTSTGFAAVYGRREGATNGNAGLFEITDAGNTFPALDAKTAGTGSAANFTVNNSGATQPALNVISNSNTAAAPGSAGKFEATGTGRALTAEINNTTNNSRAFSSTHAGLGRAGHFQNTNAANTEPTINVQSNSSTAPGININHSGTGNAITANRPIQATQFIGDGSLLTNLPAVTFPFTNTTNSASTLFDLTNTGTGRTSSFTTSNAATTSDALYAASNATSGASAIKGVHSAGGLYVDAGVRGESTGAASGISGIANGTGAAGYFNVLNNASTAPSLRVATNGLGRAAEFTIFKTDNTSNVISANTQGLGIAGNFTINNAANTNSVITANTNGTGDGVFSQLNNATSTNTAIKGRSTNVGGGAGAFEIFNATNPRSAVYAVTQGLGGAGSFDINNAANGSPALFSQTNGTGAAIQGTTSTGFASVYGRREGATNGNAGAFEITNAGNAFQALAVRTIGTGSAATFDVNNAASGATALNVSTNGTGAAIQGTTSTGWTAVYGRREGATNGHAGKFEITDAGNTSPALFAYTVGTGTSATFEVNNVASGAPGLYSTTNGTGTAILGQTSTGFTAVYGRREGATNGNAGKFEITSSGNTFPALDAVTIGTEGVAFVANHNGSSGQIAFFQSGGTNVARIDKAGKGFFNGGTQNSGADVAEMFDVEGSKSQYEPGDVLVISEANDRTVEKSSAPASTKVVGVYATKPGVVLTEKSIEESLDQLVPMGVIGVIPTKVCLENGPIKRGDLLVTSSKQGHAMKAIPVNVGGVLIYPTGAILGKALENFEGQEAGLIKVLVNVK
jgi:hypothetical protein